MGMFGKKGEPGRLDRFSVKSTHPLNSIHQGFLMVLVDNKTGVNYLVSGSGANMSAPTPLLDSNGQVIIDPIE